MFTTLRRLLSGGAVAAVSAARLRSVTNTWIETLETRALPAAGPYVTIEAVEVTRPESGPITDGGPLQITAYNVQSSKDNIAAVTFFRDRNDNGIIDSGDRVIGQGKRLIGTLDYALTLKKVSASRLPLGENTVLVRAVDKEGNFSTTEPPIGQQLTVDVQAGPGIASLTVRAALPTTLDTEFKLTAKGVRAGPVGATVTGVNFFLDNNRDGIIDEDDTLMGAGTKSSGSSTWTLTNLTLPEGTDLTQSQQFLARATNSLSQVSGTAKAVMGPSMYSLRIRDSHTLGENEDFRLVAAAVRVGGGKLKQAEFYLDSNNNGIIDVGTDLLVGTRTKTKDGAATLKLNTADIPASGNVQFLARIINRKDQISLTYAVQATLPDIET